MVQRIISDLHGITLTPSNGCYYSSSALSDSLDALLSDDSRNLEYPDFSDHEIRNYIYFILQLVDAPSNLRGILRVEGCLRHLLTVFLSHATDTAIRSQFLALFDQWINFLQQSVPSDIALLNKRPLIKDSAILFFHFAAFHISLLENGTYPFYAAYSHKFHIAIRDYKRKNPAHGSYDSTVRAARYFFLFMPPEIISLPTHPPNMPKKYIALSLTTLSKKLKSQDIKKLMKFYDRLFIQLIKRTPIKRRKKSPGKASKRKKKATDASLGTPPIGFADVIIDSEEDGEIEFITDGFILSNPDELVIDRKPHLSRSWLDTNNCRAFHFWWDRECLKLDELHALYAACTINWGKSDQFDRIILYLLLLLHFGHDSEKLLWLSRNITITPRIQKVNDQLCFVKDVPIKRKTQESYPNCKQPSNQAYLPLPVKISRLIQNKLDDSDNFFEYATSDGKKSTLSPHQVVQFIEKFVNNKRGLNITISRIQSSFYTLYSNRFGLDPIFSCYASGGLTQRLYQSQSYYIYIDAHQLAHEYLQTFKKLDSRIIGAPHENLDRELLQNEKPDNYAFFFSPDGSLSPLDIPVEGYGSPRVPLLSTMQLTVEGLKSSISGSTDIIVRHNLYVSYVHLCIEFAGGLRPRNELDQNPIDYAINHNSIVLRDKQSPIFTEERAVFLPETARKILSKLIEQFDRLKILVTSSIISSFMNTTHDQIFFFLDDKGNKIDFTLDKFRECLKSAGIDYDYPDNSPRHYLKTYLHLTGVSIDVSDAVCGHCHAGHEVLNEASAVIPREAFSACSRIIDDMLKELGFTDIPYFEQGIR